MREELLSSAHRARAIGVLVAFGAACGTPNGTPPKAAEVEHPLITAHSPARWPTATWAESSPEAQGLSSDSLAAGIRWALAHEVNIHSLLIVRNGTIVLDAYFYPFVRGTRHDVASVTKSVTALLTGIAIDRGKLRGTGEAVVPLLLDTAGTHPDPRSLDITIGDLLSMRSGLDCGFRQREPEIGVMMSSADWVRTVLSLPMVAPPGTRFGYCSPGYHLLSASITRATGENQLAFGRAALFGPLGITDVGWPVSPAGDNTGWGDLQLEPRDMAKIGLLMLSKGKWESRSVINEAWVDSIATLRARVNPGEDYGYGWWLSNRLIGMVEASGRGGQRITVIPSMNAVVVFTGGGFEPGDVGKFIAASVRGDTALPADSAAERRLHEAVALAAWAPASTPIAPSPAIAAHISGRRYLLGDNAFGLDAITITFSDSARAELRLARGGADILLPVGLDGDYRAMVEPGTGLLMAARGSWRGDGKFALELNTLAKINRFELLMTYSGNTVTIDANESTQLGHATWRGVARP